MDIALLNLANILHRSNHSRDATVSLHVAISLSPDVNVLHYTLGNIYAVSALNWKMMFMWVLIGLARL